MHCAAACRIRDHKKRVVGNGDKCLAASADFEFLRVLVLNGRQPVDQRQIVQRYQKLITQMHDANGPAFAGILCKQYLEGFLGAGRLR
jgi:hypothetical protein